MKNTDLKKIVRKVLLEAVDTSLVNRIIKKLDSSSSQYSWTLGGGTDEDAYVSAIQEIPNFETAKAINDKFNLRDSIDDEFNFDKDDDWEYVSQIFDHMESIGVKVINPTNQDSFDFDFSKNRSTIGGGDSTDQGGGQKTPDKEQEVVISKGKCKDAPSLTSICSGSAYLKSCMKGIKGSKDDAISKVQEFLISKGFKKVSKTGEVDAIYGPLTKEMVKQYQTSVNIKADGIAGPQTVSTMGICKVTNNQQGGTLPGPSLPGPSLPGPDGGIPTKPVDDPLDVKETICRPADKQVITAYNSIVDNIKSEEPNFLRRECRLVINYQMEQKEHCDNLEEVICFCGTKASSGDDGYSYMGERKQYLKNYVKTYCKSEFVKDDNKPITVDKNRPIIPGCQTPGSVIAILQQEDDKLSKEDCKILFNEAVNWYNSWKKCERGKHSPNPAYKDKCFSCLNRYNFNWKDLGSGENKVMKMYNFNKREINKKQRRELTRMESIESLNTALLYMNYDMNKTLTENKNIILKK
jgi:hypothetical protein